MHSLLPTSVCDTTPLQRLESQSSSNEPSSPTLNDGSSSGSASVASAASESGATAATTAASTGATLSFTNSEKHMNSKIEVVHLNSFLNGGGDKHKMNYNSTRKVCCRLLVDCVVLSCVGLPILGFHTWGDAYKRGFFCDDASLKHPYRESTVRSWMLYLMGFVVPIATIIAVEFFISNANRMRGFGNLSAERYYFCRLEISDWIVECYKKIGVLIFGAGVGQLTTDIAKYSIGRLRPHFFAVCQPLMYDGTTCADAVNAGRYIEEFTCQGLYASRRMLKEVRLSFPSGHANFACYTMIYIAIYLQTRVTWQRSRMFKHLLQFLFLMFAWYAALTRVSDYMHHWTDVLAGSAIGTLYAIVVTTSMW